MQFDRNGLEVLSRDECLALMQSVPVARMGLSMKALPVILPVNVAIEGDEIFVRTTAGSKVEAALQRAVVAVEADDYDPLGHSGWSVLVRGQTRFVDDRREIERLRRLWLTSWANLDADLWVAISADIVTGRRIRHDLGPRHNRATTLATAVAEDPGVTVAGWSDTVAAPAFGSGGLGRTPVAPHLDPGGSGDVTGRWPRLP